jgi:hypothetical protein
MKKLILVSIFVLQMAPMIARADSGSCDDNVVITATQDAQQIAAEENVNEDCTVDYDDLKPSSDVSYELKVTCGDELGFIYDVTVIRDKDNCQIDDISQIALE